mmetsp:Transcript_15565/g.39555  ORF Transcript_15565/g.39555 Transcript_15565/m.39555 type:complete len:422 (+) Transcript_15565:82-1347(+)
MAFRRVRFFSLFLVRAFGHLTDQRDDLTLPCKEQADSTCLSHLPPDPASFMQLNLHVDTGERSRDIDQYVVPIGQSILSAEPRASAEWFLKHFNATAVQLSHCDGVERAAVRLPPELSFIRKSLLVFIKEEPLPTGTVDLPRQLNFIASSLAQSSAGNFSYSFHFDNHFGLRSPLMAQAAADQIADGLVVAGFGHKSGAKDGDIIDGGYAAIQIPHTLQLMQLQGAHGRSGGISQTWLNLADCRIANPNGPGQKGDWWKSTFLAAKPEVAAQFSIDVLGAVKVSAGYLPPSLAPEGCTSAVWTLLPGGFQLHFAFSSRYQAYPGDIQDFTDRARSVRNLTAGVVDGLMHNSLLLSALSLDPYIRRLQALALPFVLVQASDEEFALIMDVPENDITLQLRGPRPSVGGVTPFAWCAQEFEGL